MSDDPDTRDLPKSVWSGSFRVFGVDIHCHVLETGERIIEADSIHALFEAMTDRPLDTADTGFADFVRWQRGGFH